MRKFTGSFTQQEAIPEAAIDAAVEVLRSGRLHRYNLQPGDVGEVAALEAECQQGDAAEPEVVWGRGPWENDLSQPREVAE